LNDKLRTENKASYGVSAWVNTYAGHAYLRIGGRFAKRELEYARDMIHTTLNSLKDKRMDPDRYEELKDRAISKLLLYHKTPEFLTGWISREFYHREIYKDFPDLVSYFRNKSQAELADHLQDKLDRSHQVVSIYRAFPIPYALVIFLGILWILALINLIRLWWSRPVDLRTIRYMRKIRYPITYITLIGLPFIALSVFFLQAVKLGTQYLQWLFDPWDSFLIWIVGQGLILSIFVMAFLLIPAQIPWKILLFDSEWRLKFLTFRSKRYSYNDIKEIYVSSFFKLLFSRHALCCIFLYWGIFRKGIYLRTGKRFGYFFRVRNNQELIDQFTILQAENLCSKNGELKA
jgi:hypothetical protein